MALDLNIEQITSHLEKLTKLPRPARMALVPAIVTVVVGAYVYFMFLPGQAQMKQIEAQQQQLQRKLNEVRSTAGNLERFEAKIAELEQKFAVALRQLPNGKELPVLLTDISSLGKNAGLEVKAFRPQPEVRRDFYAEVPIDIEFTGRFHDIASFFDEVSRLPRIVNIGRLDMAIREENSMDTMLSVKGQAQTFRFIENAAARPAGAAGAQGKGTR
jgi:type IV pilus assembly protein PilO